jgi:hypothetical protein
MAGLGQKFDPRNVDTEQRSYDNLPDGIYKLEVSAADVKSGDGKTSVNATIRVIEPENYAGRQFFSNYNIEHPNATTQEIGEKQFGSLCRALGIDKPVEDSDELLFEAFFGKVGMGKDSKEKNDDGSPRWPARNEVKRYYFPDKEEMPTPVITGSTSPKPANDNRRPAANDNAAPSTEQKKRPWGQK